MTEQSPHDHSRPSGCSIEALGLCVAEDSCRERGHTLARTTLPQTVSGPPTQEDICVTCTEQAGRLEGLRLWKSVCPCCFSSAFPGGMPSLEETHSRTKIRTQNTPTH